jgi:hypothetical protein
VDILVQRLGEHTIDGTGYTCERAFSFFESASKIIKKTSLCEEPQPGEQIFYISADLENARGIRPFPQQ